MKYDKKLYEQKRNEALHLRVQGDSTRTIAKKLKISRSTASVWTRSITPKPELKTSKAFTSQLPPIVATIKVPKNDIDKLEELITSVENACQQQDDNLPKVMFDKGYSMAKVNEPFRMLCVLFMRLQLGDETNYRLEWNQTLDSSKSVLSEIKLVNNLFKYIPQNLGWQLILQTDYIERCKSLVEYFATANSIVTDDMLRVCQGKTLNGNRVIAYANTPVHGVQYLFEDPKVVYHFIKGGITYVKDAIS